MAFSNYLLDKNYEALKAPIIISWVVTRDVQIIAFSIFGPCCDDVIASALEQYLGPCNNGNEAVEEMSRSVKISILC